MASPGYLGVCIIALELLGLESTLRGNPNPATTDDGGSGRADAQAHATVISLFMCCTFTSPKRHKPARPDIFHRPYSDGFGPVHVVHPIISQPQSDPVPTPPPPPPPVAALRPPPEPVPPIIYKGGHGEGGVGYGGRGGRGGSGGLGGCGGDGGTGGRGGEGGRGNAMASAGAGQSHK